VTCEDGVDFVPARPFPLLAQHFSAISAAGPIVGPIIAGLEFGWLPGLLWILLGAVFIGAVHDFSTLVASVRHGARSVAEIMREHVGTPAFLLFITFIWLSLVLVIIAFTDVTARLFVRGELDMGGVAVTPGPGVASSSMMYLALALLMGLALTKLRLGMKFVGTAGVVLLIAIIGLGPHLPLHMPAAFGPDGAVRAWIGVILLYCFFASVVPLSLLLQPRGFLGGILLYVFVAVGLAGLFFGDYHAVAPAMRESGATGLPIFPFLFVTIACGACSGFHGLVCSGTTSRQLSRESHARPVAYGGMLLEGVVAVIALATVMMAARSALPLMPDGKTPDPNAVFASGIASFANSVFRLPRDIGLQFGFLALATFIYDTLDVCTRLGRYLLQELSAAVFKRPLDKYTATLLTIAVPGAILLGGVDYRDAWKVFGASNQLLAALSLLGIAVWLRRRGRRPWYTIVPMAFVMTATVAALIGNAADSAKPDVLRALSVVLLAVASAIIALAARPLLRPARGERPFMIEEGR
jgi:carbon starvation protein